ncbi:hypothetical protein Trydic_g1997 [Trypoxylus dichotomus]
MTSQADRCVMEEPPPRGMALLITVTPTLAPSKDSIGIFAFSYSTMQLITIFPALEYVPRTFGLTVIGINKFEEYRSSKESHLELRYRPLHFEQHPTLFYQGQRVGQA